MKQIEKTRNLGLKKADNIADIELINTYTRSPLRPEQVYCFSVVLCDNEVDRDGECFSDNALETLATLFVGKTGILDHERKAMNQIARLYRVEVVGTDGKNSFGKQLKRLVGSAYVLKNEETRPIIEAIEGGILKEVSVSCSIAKVTCSICGRPAGECEHRRGKEYDGVTCAYFLEEPTDAYEFSFVAVPAQRGAGVTKAAKDFHEAVKTILDTDLSEYETEAEKLSDHIARSKISSDERKHREEILAENKKFLIERN